MARKRKRKWDRQAAWLQGIYGPHEERLKATKRVRDKQAELKAREDQALRGGA